jgi:hypothetical protein
MDQDLAKGPEDKNQDSASSTRKRTKKRTIVIEFIEPEGSEI